MVALIAPASALSRLREGLLSLAAVTLGLFLLMSPAGTSVGLVLMLAAAALMLPAVWSVRPWREPAMALGLLLFAYIAVHTLAASQGQAEQWNLPPLQAVGKYQELWLAPVLLAVFAVGGRLELFWRALLAGALVYAAIHWLDRLGLPVVPPEKIGSRRISAGLGLLAVAWVAQERAWASRHRAWLLTASLFLAATVLFAMEGRTGHVLLLVLAALWGWLHGRGAWRWLLPVLLPLLVAAGAMSSTAVQNRMADTLSVTGKPTTPEGFSSATIRREYYTTGLELALAHPWTGQGYGHIAAPFHERVQAKADDPSQAAFAASPYSRPANLHNEYLMHWVGGGLAALLLLAAWLAAPLLSRGRSPAVQRSVAGLVVAFAVGCMFNSWLLDFTEGHVFSVLLAWLLAHGHAPAHRTAA